MNRVILVSFLALATLCLCHAADLGHSNSANDSPSSEAFISRRESAAVIKRQKRNFARVAAAAAAAPTGKPYEGLWEVCELNAACDDLASLVGIQEAYRRFYGPV